MDVQVLQCTYVKQSMVCHALYFMGPHPREGAVEDYAKCSRKIPLDAWLSPYGEEIKDMQNNSLDTFRSNQVSDRLTFVIMSLNCPSFQASVGWFIIVMIALSYSSYLSYRNTSSPQR